MAARRGRPPASDPGLDVQALLSAGLRVIERSGLEMLTMRKVADDLGAQVGSLYWHVRSKEELLDLLADEVLADLDLTPYATGTDWRTSISDMMRAMRRYLVDRRDAPRLLAGRFSAGPHLVRHIETMLGVLRSTTLSDRDTAYALYLMVALVLGFVANEQEPLSAQVQAGLSPRTFLDGLRDALANLPAAEYPNTVTLATELTAPNLEHRFEFALDCVLDGIAARIPN